MPQLLVLLLAFSISLKTMAEESQPISLDEPEVAEASVEIHKDVPEVTSETKEAPADNADMKEDTSTDTSSEAQEVVQDKSSEEDTAAVEIPGNSAVTCTSMFLEMIKSQPAKEQEKYMDDYFTLINGYQYRSDKMDEFAWKEKEPQYKKLYAATLAEKEVYEIFSLVKLGKYDFKKKGFPVEVATDKTGLLKTFYRSSIGFVMFGGQLLGGEILCTGMGMTKNTPNQLYVRMPNLQKFKFINVSEEVAKGITPALGESRLAYATFTVSIDKIKSSQQDKLRLGVKNMVYDVTATAQKVNLTVEDKLVGEFTF